MIAIPPLVQALMNRGVRVHAPTSVHIDPGVDVSRIEQGVAIHAGCRLFGAQLSIGPGCEIGREAPATLTDCRLGSRVVFAGGCATDAVFLDGVSVGSGAHVRAGTLLEEQSIAAHTVGLKQTVLMPFVTLGSLINFCDCLMAGGTDRGNHSEVGSSYVHFNFTPHHDKATPSLIGDVPRGVMLDQPPIFLGGQGGLVGPCRVEYGTVIAAGTVYRHDVAEKGSLVFGQFSRPAGQAGYVAGLYGDIRRQVTNNLIYIGNLAALTAWYRHAREPFLSRTPSGARCLGGALAGLEAMVNERLARMRELAGKMPVSIDLARHRNAAALNDRAHRDQACLADRWAKAEARLRVAAAAGVAEADRDTVLAGLKRAGDKGDYVAAVKALSPESRAAGTRWLQAIVDAVVAAAQVLDAKD
jgi:UDP-N-acetylglucosamine/UDP-N-acetylgalactosamine diphosphorylase